MLVTAVFLGASLPLHRAASDDGGLFSLQPIYDPATFNVRALAAGTSLAALVFIGFDGVSILAEEVNNPQRNVLLAAVLVCLFTGLFSGLQVYLAQSVWPDYTTLQNRRPRSWMWRRIAGGALLFAAYGVVLIVSSLACGLGRACWRGAPALRHGPRRCHSEKDLRPPEPERRQSCLQRVDRRRFSRTSRY